MRCNPQLTTPIPRCFGKLLYELSTGLDRSRFPSLPTQLHEFEDAPLIASLNMIILKACDPKPSRRFRSAAELEKALLKLTPDGGTRAAILTPTAANPPKSVAVLPFSNMSAERENELAPCDVAVGVQLGQLLTIVGLSGTKQEEHKRNTSGARAEHRRAPAYLLATAWLASRVAHPAHKPVIRSILLRHGVASRSARTPDH